MTRERLNIGREELSKVFKDKKSIRQFEKVFEIADVVDGSDVQGTQLEAGESSSLANNVNSKLEANTQEYRAEIAILSSRLEQALSEINSLKGFVNPANQDIIKEQLDVSPPISSVSLDSVEGVLSVSKGGTGDRTYTNGQILIGNSGTLDKATVTAGSNISVANGAGSITIGTSGASGSFTAGSGETITVSNGIITSIV